MVNNEFDCSAPIPIPNRRILNDADSVPQRNSIRRETHIHKMFTMLVFVVSVLLLLPASAMANTAADSADAYFQPLDHCSLPPTVDHGEWNIQWRSIDSPPVVGSIATLNCVPPYVPSDDARARLECQSVSFTGPTDGGALWNDSFVAECRRPACKLEFNSAIPLTVYHRQKSNMLDAKDVVMLDCPRGYHLVGCSQFECSLTGQLECILGRGGNHSMPECVKAAYCPPLPEFVYGGAWEVCNPDTKYWRDDPYPLDQFAVGDIAKLLCTKPDYGSNSGKAYPFATIECLRSQSNDEVATWNVTELPRCSPVTCPPIIPAMLPSRVILQKLRYKATANSLIILQPILGSQGTFEVICAEPPLQERTFPNSSISYAQEAHVFLERKGISKMTFPRPYSWISCSKSGRWTTTQMTATIGGSLHWEESEDVINPDVPEVGMEFYSRFELTTRSNYSKALIFPDCSSRSAISSFLHLHHAPEPETAKFCPPLPSFSDPSILGWMDSARLHPSNSLLVGSTAALQCGPVFQPDSKERPTAHCVLEQDEDSTSPDNSSIAIWQFRHGNGSMWLGMTPPTCTVAVMCDPLLPVYSGWRLASSRRPDQFFLDDVATCTKSTDQGIQKYSVRCELRQVENGSAIAVMEPQLTPSDLACEEVTCPSPPPFALAYRLAQRHSNFLGLIRRWKVKFTPGGDEPQLDYFAVGDKILYRCSNQRFSSRRRTHFKIECNSAGSWELIDGSYCEPPSCSMGVFSGSNSFGMSNVTLARVNDSTRQGAMLRPLPAERLGLTLVDPRIPTRRLPVWLDRRITVGSTVTVTRSCCVKDDTQLPHVLPICTDVIVNITCVQVDGVRARWSHDERALACPKSPKCPSLPNVEGGEWKLERDSKFVRHHSTVTARLDCRAPMYEVDDPKTVTCDTETGSWSPELPQCQRIKSTRCRHLDDVVSRIGGSSWSLVDGRGEDWIGTCPPFTRFASSSKLFSQHGFRNHDTRSIVVRCSQFAWLWSWYAPSDLACLPVTCPSLHAEIPSNLIQSSNTTGEFGRHATFTCEDQQLTLFCGMEGQWLEVFEEEQASHTVDVKQKLEEFSNRCKLHQSVGKTTVSQRIDTDSSTFESNLSSDREVEFMDYACEGTVIGQSASRRPEAVPFAMMHFFHIPKWLLSDNPAIGSDMYSVTMHFIEPVTEVHFMIQEKENDASDHHQPSPASDCDLQNLKRSDLDFIIPVASGVSITGPASSKEVDGLQSFVSYFSRSSIGNISQNCVRRRTNHHHQPHRTTARILPTHTYQERSDTTRSQYISLQYSNSNLNISDTSFQLRASDSRHKTFASRGWRSKFFSFFEHESSNVIIRTDSFTYQCNPKRQHTPQGQIVGNRERLRMAANSDRYLNNRDIGWDTRYISIAIDRELGYDIISRDQQKSIQSMFQMGAGQINVPVSAEWASTSNPWPPRQDSFQSPLDSRKYPLLYASLDSVDDENRSKLRRAILKDWCEALQLPPARLQILPIASQMMQVTLEPSNQDSGNEQNAALHINVTAVKVDLVILPTLTPLTDESVASIAERLRLLLAEGHFFNPFLGTDVSASLSRDYTLVEVDWRLATRTRICSDGQIRKSCHL